MVELIKPSAKKLWLSRFTLLLGYFVIAATGVLTLMALMFGQTLLSIFIFGLIIGIALIIISHNLVARPILEPNKPIKLVGLGAIIVGYFITIVAGLITLFEFFMAESLLPKILSLLFVFIGVVLVAWANNVRNPPQ